MNTHAISPRILLILGIVVVLVVMFLSTGNVLAQNSGAAQAACEGVALTGQACDANAETSLQGIITEVIRVLSILVGAISVIMIVIGGLRFVTAGGDSSRVASARQTIVYAVVGLVVSLFAGVIVSYVITESDQAITPAPAEDE